MTEGLQKRRSRAIELLESSPVIAAVKDEAGLKACFESDCQVVFVLKSSSL